MPTSTPWADALRVADAPPGVPLVGPAPDDRADQDRGASPAATRGPPDSPRPRDIVLKAIDKDPDAATPRPRRWPKTCGGSSTTSRSWPVGRRRRAVRPVGRRYPGIAVLGGVLTAVLLLATAISTTVAGNMSRLANDYRRPRRRLARGQEADQRARAQESQRLAEASAKEKAEADFAKARAAVDESFTKISESQLLKVPGMQPLRRKSCSSRPWRSTKDSSKSTATTRMCGPAWPPPSSAWERSAASSANPRGRRNPSRRLGPYSSRSSRRTRRSPNWHTASARNPFIG